jgi:hypothetical protein
MKNWVSYRQLEIENVVILVFDEADEMLKADAFADDTGGAGNVVDHYRSHGGKLVCWKGGVSGEGVLSQHAAVAVRGTSSSLCSHRECMAFDKADEMLKADAFADDTGWCIGAQHIV